jgi:hypothetical protein
MASRRYRNEPPAWKWALDLDFTACTLQDVGVGAGAKTICGKTFTLVNGGAYLDSLVINAVAGDGLKADCSAANSTCDTSADTVPQLSIALSTLIPSYDPYAPHRVWAVVNQTDADAATELVGVGTGNAAGDYGFALGTGFLAAAGSRMYRQNGAAVTTGDTAGARNCLCIERYHGSTTYYGGTATGVIWPAFASLTLLGSASTNKVPALVTSFASTDVASVWWATGNVSNNFEAAILRFGVQYVPRWR